MPQKELPQGLPRPETCQKDKKTKKVHNPTSLRGLEENLVWKKADIDFASIVAEDIIRRRSGRRR